MEGLVSVCCPPWPPSSQTWSSWRFSSRVWTGSSWCEAAAVKWSPSTPKRGKKTTKKTLSPHHAQHGLSPWLLVTGHFPGGSPIWFLWRGRGLLEGGIPCDWLKDGGDQLALRESAGWAEQARSVSPPDHSYPRTWTIEHRDTLYCSISLWKSMFSLTFYNFFPSCVDVVKLLALTVLKKKWMCVSLIWNPHSLPEGTEMFAGPEKKNMHKEDKLQKGFVL